MAEGNAAQKTLAIKITPKLDVDALTKQIKEALTKAGLPLQAGQGAPAGQQGQSQDKTNVEGEGAEGKKLLTKDNAVLAIRTVGKVVKVGLDATQKTFNGILGIIKDIHGRVKQASAFLETVENLFNLAMTLLLMPLGNALAEVILPSAVNLVEKVVKLWDQFEQYTGKQGLKSIISIVMSQGIQLIGTFFKEIGRDFRDSGDTLLKGISNLFNWIGNLMENGKLANLFNMMFTIFEKLTGAMHIWIPMIIGLMTQQLLATALSGIPIIGKYAAAISAVGGVAVTAGAEYYLNSADGGEIPQTAGGQLVRVAEHETEVIMPKSQLQNMGGNTYNFTVNGYTTEEVKQLIRDFISTEISNSQYRSGL